ncbi:MAG: pyrrolo-quinoline quinone, partial [Anaerolineae bacterium]|nr:pyrrolo-quinoline quinone [Anaerolineae bacterium]
YCPDGLENTRYYDFGFYIYYNQGAVYDQYWSEYATWVVSKDNVYFRSCDGAVVAFTSGNPQDLMESPLMPVALQVVRPVQDTAPVATIPYTEARLWAGRMVTVIGVVRYGFNNGKQVLLGFEHPHQGAFKVLIRRTDWPRFTAAPEILYPSGKRIAVTGVVSW